MTIRAARYTVKQTGTLEGVVNGFAQAKRWAVVNLVAITVWPRSELSKEMEGTRSK